MKKRLWTAKVVVHTIIWLEKRESDILNWNVWCSKSQRLTLNIEISKISSIVLNMRCIVKNDQMLWFVQKPNEKLLRFVIIFLWEVIYVHFYNWDKPLDLVPVLYDLIELIIEASLWSKDYSTFDTHPQRARLSSINAYLICVIVHIQMWCVCSIACRSNPKYFWVFYMFFKVILYFHTFSFCSKCIFVLFFKNLFRGIFTRSSRLRASCEKSSREI